MKHIYRFLSLFLLLCSASALRAAAPVITSSLSSQTYWVNEDFNYTITATGSPILFYAGGYQAVGGLTLDSATGAITGAPSNAGEFEIAIAAENAALERSAEVKFDVVVVPTAITSLSSANGVVGETFSYEITTSSSELVTFTDDGTLPPGLTRVDNIISGTPTVSGTYPVALSASDVNGSGEIVVTFEITGAVPVITSSLQEEILLGDNFDYTITATYSPDFFTGSSGAVSGLSSVNATTGEFSGTPVSSGNYSITLLARTPLPEGVFSSPTTLNLVVHPGLITSSNTASAVVDSPFVFEITTVNDEGLAYSNDDNLPPGLTRTDNIISGIPTLAGTYNVTISAASINDFDDQVLTITVTDPTPEITSSLADQNILAGVPYVGYQITATYPPLTGFSEIGLSAVGGLVLDTVTGEISGTPVNSGSFPIEIRASNSTGFGDPATFNLNVSPTVITSPSSTSGVVGTPLTYEITTAGTAPLAYGVQGSLPSGLSRSGTTISGTPDQAGTYTVTLSASNLDGTGSLEVTFTITDPAPAIDSSLVAQTIIVNEPFSYTITATNNPTVFSANGLDLIGGLVLDTGTGVISGTPLNEGDWVIKIGAENGAGTSPIEDLNLVVKAAQYFLEGEVSVPFSHTLTTTLPNASIGVTGLGQIPGISRVSGTDDISGTPEKFGIYVVTVTATDEEGATDTYDLTVTINKSGGAAPIPVITSSTSILLYEGDNLDYQIQADGIPDSFEVFGLGSLGLALNSSTGEITGTPTSTGDFRLPVRVTNAAGTGSDILELTIVPDISPEVVITSPAGGNAFTAGDYIEVLINATDTDGFITAVSVSVDGVLDGFATSTGVAGQYRYILTTTAGDVGTRSLQVTATDDRDNSTDSNIQNFAVTPGAVPQVSIITPAAGFYATVGVPYEIRVSAVDPDGVIAAVGLNDILFGREPPTTSTDSDGVVTVTPGDIIDETKSFGGQQDETVLTLMQPSSTPGEYVLNVTATFTDIVDLVATAIDDAGNAVSSVPVQYSVNLGIPPDVTITSPLVGENFTLGDYVPVEVTANDADGIITQVEIFNSSISLGFADLTGLNTYRFGYLANAAGEVYLQARATDDTGNVSNSDFEIINVATGNIPTVSITAPIAGGNSPYKLGDTLAIEITASDSDGNVTTVEVFAVDVFNGIISLGTATRTGNTTFSLNYTANALGTFNLYARAVDDSGNTSVSAVETITVATGDLPTAIITSPINGGNSPYKIGDIIPIDITASDLDGSVTTVEVFDGNTSLGTAIRTGDTTFRLNYKAIAVGTFDLQARVVDDRGNTSVSAIETITVVTGDLPVVAIDELNSVSDGDSITAGDTVQVLVNASDADGFITQVQIFGNEELLGQADPTGVAGQYRYNLSTDIEDVGILTLEARATDDRGNEVSSSVVNLNVTPGSVPSVSIDSPSDGFTAQVGVPFEVRVSASDADGSIASVRLRDINFQREEGTTNNGVFTPGAVIEETRSFNGALMQESSVAGEYVYTATLSNPDIVDLVAVALDNAGNQVTSVPVQLTVTTGSAPTVTITSPVAGGNSPYKLGDTVVIDITASDSDGSVSGVQVYNGSAILGTATRTGNTTFSLNYTANAVGSVNLQARVTDDSGNTSVSAVETITVETGDLPTAIITSPINGGNSPYKIGDIIPIDITASDLDGSVTTVEVFDGNTSLGTATRTGDTTFRLNYKAIAVGTFDLQARVVDDRGNTSVSAIETITVVTGDLPVVAIDELNSVSDGDSITAGDNVTILVNASDADGFITQVQIFGNEELLGQADPTGVAGQYRYNLSTDIEDVGILTLEARATDDRGNEVSSSVVNLNVTPGSVPEVSVITPIAGASQVVNQTFEIRVSATDSDGVIAGVRLSDTRFSRLPPTINGSTGIVTPGAVIESTRSFNEDLMQPSSIAGEFVYFATLTNTDIVDLEATAFDNAGNEVSAVVVQFFVTDGTPPTVSIDSPVAGSIISRGSFAPIEITASDADGTVQQIEVFNGAISLGFATPLGGLNKYRLDYQANSPGEVYLQARATDDRGNVAVSNIETFTVETGDIPFVSITTPTSGETIVAGKSTEILLEAFDLDGVITQVSVYNGDTLLGEAESTGVTVGITEQYRFIYTAYVGSGTQNLEARVVDEDGNVATSSLVQLVVLRGSSPVVEIMNPVDAEVLPVGIEIEIRVSASDVDGNITSVQLYDSNFEVYDGRIYNNAEVVEDLA